jgi:hypothetical protein
LAAVYVAKLDIAGVKFASLWICALLPAEVVVYCACGFEEPVPDPVVMMLIIRGFPLLPVLLVESAGQSAAFRPLGWILLA